MIYDPYGNPVTSGPKFASAAINDGQSRAVETVRKKTINELIPQHDHNTIVYVASRLYYNMPVVKAAIDQRAMYSVGRAFQPKFYGKDREWGKRATEWLVEKWFPACDVRGPNRDWATGLYLDSVHIDRDGDVGCIYTENATGWPQLQRVSAFRIGTRQAVQPYTVLLDGPYRGLRIVKGVVINQFERPVAYHVLGDAEDGSQDRYVAARDMDLIYDETSHDSVRGFPCFMASLNTFRDMLQSGEYEMNALLINGMLAMVEHNEDGLAPAMSPMQMISSGGKPQTPVARETEITNKLGGLIKYVKAGSGAKIEAISQNRPGAEWEAFMDRGIRAALAEMGWSMSLVWKPTGQGTAERVELAKAERAVKDRQDVLASAARRRIAWAVAKAIKIGQLPPYEGKDQGGMLKWGFTYPQKMSIDFGRDWRAKIDAWRAGFVNMSEIITENGGVPEESYYERAREVAMRKRIAREVAEAEGEEITDEDMSIKAQSSNTQIEESNP